MALGDNWLEIQGMTVRCSTFRVFDATAGRRGVTDTGRPYFSRAGRFRLGLEFTTVPVEYNEARFWFELFAGEGEVWGETNYSSKGTRSINKMDIFGTSKFGSNAQATTGSEDFAYVPYNEWTVLLHHTPGATWNHYVLCSDGTKYRDNAVFAGAIPFSVAGGVLTFDDSGYYDDVVILPAVIPPALVTDLWNTSEWHPLPKLRVATRWDADGWWDTLQRTFKPLDAPSFVPSNIGGSELIEVSATLVEST